VTLPWLAVAAFSGFPTLQDGSIVPFGRFTSRDWIEKRTDMILIISGTNRPDSNTRKVAGHVEGIYETLGVEFQVLDLTELPPEIFSPTSYADKPADFQRFSNAILASDGIVLVTPEYNGGIPGILKYFIDMLPFPESFERRPVCFVGVAAGIWGALRPIEQLQAIFGYRNAFIYPERVFIPGIGNQLDPSGTFIRDDIPKRLKQQAAGFVEFVEKLRGTTLRRKIAPGK
jgi:NAD(P)H-dependent FMN reductase